jgi:outer membrane protein assembly factor BamB
MKTAVTFAVWMCLLAAGSAGRAAAADQPAPAGNEAPGFLSAKVNPGQTGFADYAPVLKPRLRWTLNLPPVLSHEAIQPVTAKGGQVLYLTAGGLLIQADADKGTVLWQEMIKALGHPVIRDNTLYVYGASFVKAFDISGDKPALKWTAPVTKPFIADSKYCMEVADGIVVSANLGLFGYGRLGCKYGWEADATVGDTSLHAVQVADGKPAWTFDPGQIISPTPGRSPTCSTEMA